MKFRRKSARLQLSVRTTPYVEGQITTRQIYGVPLMCVTSRKLCTAPTTTATRTKLRSFPSIKMTTFLTAPIMFSSFRELPEI